MIAKVFIGAAALTLTVALVLGCSSNSPSAPPVDTGPKLSVNDVAQNEDISPAKFVVTLSAAATSDVIFSYATQDGTAQAGSDYVAVTGTDTIIAGTTKDTINVAIIDDAVLEQAETFSLVLSGASGATIQDGTGICTINLNDGATAGVSFVNEVKPILDANCAVTGCHVSGSSVTVFIMGDVGNAVWSQVRNGRGVGDTVIVKIGNGAGSPLYYKTTTTFRYGVRMPKDATPLSITDQQKIRDWINQNALNN